MNSKADDVLELLILGDLLPLSYISSSVRTSNRSLYIMALRAKRDRHDVAGYRSILALLKADISHLPPQNNNRYILQKVFDAYCADNRYSQG